MRGGNIYLPSILTSMLQSYKSYFNVDTEFVDNINTISSKPMHLFYSLSVEMGQK